VNIYGKWEAATCADLAVTLKMNKQRGENKMSNQQTAKAITLIEDLIREGILSFDDLQLLSSQAYAKEAAQDEQ
jgi:hypothetical protein